MSLFDFYKYYQIVLFGEGQEAMSVTTIAEKFRKFKTQFFYLVHEEKFGSI